jgi:hypothetical protein
MNGKYSAGLSYLKQTMGALGDPAVVLKQTMDALGDTSCSFKTNHGCSW